MIVNYKKPVNYFDGNNHIKQIKFSYTYDTDGGNNNNTPPPPAEHIVNPTLIYDIDFEFASDNYIGVMTAPHTEGNMEVFLDGESKFFGNSTDQLNGLYIPAPSGVRRLTIYSDVIDLQNIETTNIAFITRIRKFYSTSITKLDWMYSGAGLATPSYSFTIDPNKENEPTIWMDHTNYCNISHMFDSSALEYVPDGIFAGIKYLAVSNGSVINSSTCHEVFANCIDLKEIKGYIFDELYTDFYNVTHFQGWFKYCSSLNKISYNTFRLKSTGQGIALGATDSDQCGVANCFYGCSSLGASGIPQALFPSESNIYSFMSVFQGCFGLDNGDVFLLTNPFAGCNPTYATSIFRSCNELQELPVGIFSTFTNCVSYQSAFENCNKLGHYVSLNKAETPEFMKGIFNAHANGCVMDFAFYGVRYCYADVNLVLSNVTGVASIGYIFSAGAGPYGWSPFFDQAQTTQTYLVCKGKNLSSYNHGPVWFGLIPLASPLNALITSNDFANTGSRGLTGAFTSFVVKQLP